MNAPTIGLFLHNAQLVTDPDLLGQVAGLAEDLGYDSLWAPDHVVVPSPRVVPSPVDPDEPMLDPLVLLGHLAARTRRIRLGTGVVVLPQRNPLVLAKQVSSVDVLSGGRVELGVGAGYLEPELRALGVPLNERASRTDEFLAALDALWTSPAPEFHGRHVDFAGVDAHPRPVQRPLPIVIGGHTPPARRRAARHGAGWYGFQLSPEQVRTQVDGLRAAADAAGRTTPLHIAVTPDRPLDPDTVAAYAAAGAQRLIVAFPARTPAARLAELVEAAAPEKLGARHAEAVKPA